MGRFQTPRRAPIKKNNLNNHFPGVSDNGSVKVKISTVGFAFFGVCSLTIALPLLGTLSEGATFFVAHSALAPDILLFVLGIYFLPPLILIGVALAVRLIIKQSAALVFASIALGILAALWAMSLASGVPTVVAITIGLVFGALVCWAYLARTDVRSFFKIVGQVSPIIPIYILAFTPINNLFLPDSVDSYGVERGAEIPVVMLILDELSMAGLVTPDGEIDAGRLPNFARLERTSTWYHEATTVSAYTEKAVPAILSGLLPEAESVPIYNQYPQNLFTVLANSHDVHAIEQMTWMCPPRVCGKSGKLARAISPLAMYRDAGYVWLHSVLPVELRERYLPSISSGWRDFGGSEDPNKRRNDIARIAHDQVAKLRARLREHPARIRKSTSFASIPAQTFEYFIDSIRVNTGAQLHYMHLALPHKPWIYFPDGTIYNGESFPGLTPQNIWIDDQDLANQGVLQYALQVEYVDQLLGDLLDLLEDVGRLDETLLIILGDHGLAFTPGKSIRVPDASILADVSRIPLFIKYPGQRLSKRDLRKVQTIDILPTIAEVINVQLTGAVDGRSLISDSWKAVTRQVWEADKDIPNFEAAMEIKHASERIYRVIAPGQSAIDSFGTDTSRPFMGTSIQVVDRRDNQLTLQLDKPELYKNLNLESDTLPARLSGTVEGAVRGTEIVIALNGTYAGSGMTYDDQGSISILLDPRHFRGGINDLAAYKLLAGELSKIEISSGETAD